MSVTSPPQRTVGLAAVLSGRAALLLAVIVFGSAGAVVRKLTELGAQNLVGGVDGRNPISFCNVLFVGNLCALLLLAVTYHREWRPSRLRVLAGVHWQALLAVSVLGVALAPSLLFLALENTTVNSVVLISRIEPPLILALSVSLLGERVNALIVAGAVLSALGVVATLALQPSAAGPLAMGGGLGFGLGHGELMTIFAACILAISTLISKVALAEVPVGIISGFRMLFGTVLFFVVALSLFGPRHFPDVASPFLWKWMLVYGGIIVVCGQLLWYRGLATSSPSEVSLASTLNPVAGFLAAFLILGQAPTMPQWIGGAIILAGMALNQVGLARLRRSGVTRPTATSTEAPEPFGFKGV